MKGEEDNAEPSASAIVASSLLRSADLNAAVYFFNSIFFCAPPPPLTLTACIKSRASRSTATGPSQLFRPIKVSPPLLSPPPLCFPHPPSSDVFRAAPSAVPEMLSSLHFLALPCRRVAVFVDGSEDTMRLWLATIHGVFDPNRQVIVVRDDSDNSVLSEDVVLRAATHPRPFALALEDERVVATALNLEELRMILKP
jgi:hypothetical protein